MAQEAKNTVAIDLSDDTIFDPSHWIKKGKKFPTIDTPLHISDAWSNTFLVPESIKQSIFPHATISVPNFIQLAQNYPRQPATLANTHPDTWFSREHPNSDIRLLLKRAIPDKEVIRKLVEVSGQAWFDGNQSICDPRFNNRQERFPLYAIGFWREIADLRIAATIWERAQRWTHERAMDSVAAETAAETVEDLMEELGWNISIRSKTTHAYSPDLAGLLGSGKSLEQRGWLSDSVIDLMVDTLREQLTRMALKGRLTSIQCLGFSHQMSRAVRERKETYTRKDFGLLYGISDCVHKRQLESLYFPLLTGKCHWIAVHVDFTKNLIQYGDSIGNKSTLPPEIRMVQKWTQLAFGS
ncbi:hypothetical protein K474DRAFT_1711492 [Panus rudis PR-1116 ss-1]|nr:hypothetical protein K474DRAFT_1711492 [Panus rudis PR-1116 ss-1]